MAEPPNSEDRLFDELRSAVDAQGRSPPERAPSRFTELRLAGRGGQGVVYRARDRSTGEWVALKLLPRFAKPSDLARLEREIEFLRRVEHPGVVRVLDGGVEEGVPFVAMEWVGGEPLLRWVERRCPPLRERLQVAIAVADAVEAAHRRGVLHRDLKPSNVLVDERGNPRVVDFGIARSLSRSSSQTTSTRSGFRGTLAYAAPEQLTAGSQTAADTRSDVYSLALLVYELLCGALPYPVGGSEFQVQRGILEQDPIDPRRLAPHVPRDVSTILLRALAKDPERRTPTAGAFADDLRRVLDGRPIEARRDLLGTVIWQRVRRRPGLVVGSLLALLGLGVAGGMAVQSRLERQRQRHTSEQVRGVFQDLLAAAAPQGMARTVGLMEVFEDVARRVDVELADAPDAQAAVQLSIGETYLRALLVDEALPHLRAALARYREHDRDDQLQVARTLDALGRTLAQQNRPEAIEVQREALALRRAALGDDDPRVALSRRGLAEAILFAYPQPLDAPEQPQQLLAMARTDLARAYGEEHVEVAITLARIAGNAAQFGDAADATRAFQRALELFEQLAAEDPERLRCLDQYAAFLRREQRFDDAEAVLGQAIALARQLFGGAHVVEVLRGFANLHYDRGDDATSEKFSVEALAVELESWAVRRPGRATELARSAAELRACAEREPRVPPFESAFQQVAELSGPGAYEVAQWMTGVAVLQRRLGRDRLADELLRRSLDIGCRHFGAECPVRIGALELLGERYYKIGRVAEAAVLLEEVVATRRRLGTADEEHGLRAARLLAACRQKEAGR